MGIDAKMFVRVPRKLTRSDLRVAEHKLCERFYPDDLETWRDSFLEIVEEWHQDGPTIEPKVGETFVRANLWTRYYGPGYERGNFRFIHDLAEVLESIFPDGEVWYGGDSSGVVAQPFGPKQRAELRAHWLKFAHVPYQRSSVRFMIDCVSPQPTTPTCSRCEVPMNRYGWGPSYAAYTCECGERVVLRDGQEKRVTTKQRRELKRELERIRHAAAKRLEKDDPTAFKRYQELVDLDIG